MVSNAYRDCADVVRIGSAQLNGTTLSWEVLGRTSNDFHTFSTRFKTHVRQLLPEENLDDQTLDQMARNICKAVSGNFMLGAVVKELRQLLDMPEDHSLLVETEREGMLADYFIDVKPRCNKLKVGMRWHWKNNIVEVADGSKTVRGSISLVETEIDWKTCPGFTPDYHMCVRLKRSSWRKDRRCKTCRIACHQPLVDTRHWVYDPSSDTPFMIRSEPIIDGPQTNHILVIGERFKVALELKIGNVIFLKLADGRGWAFDCKPGVGQMCRPAEGLDDGIAIDRCKSDLGNAHEVTKCTARWRIALRKASL